MSAWSGQYVDVAEEVAASIADAWLDVDAIESLPRMSEWNDLVDLIANGIRQNLDKLQRK